MNNVVAMENNDNQEPLLSCDNDNYCVICLEDIQSYSSYTFDCSHQLHVKCFHKYFFYNYDVERNYISCPICRTELNVEIQPIKESKCTVFCKYFIILFCVSSIGLSFFPFDNLLKN